MELYPPEYLNHDCPFLMLSGVAVEDSDSDGALQWPFEKGTRGESALPLVDLPAAKRIANGFCERGFYGMWPQRRDKPAKGAVAPLFRVKTVGRVVDFPARKAKPPPGNMTVQSDEQTSLRSLHSPISPLSPESPVFPDGIITPWWLRKHSDFIPCHFLSFYEMATGAKDAKYLTTQDNLIIASINNLKKIMTTASTFPSSSLPNEPSTRRTKLVVLIFSEISEAESPGLKDRIQHIQRMTNMDTKSNFFVVPPRASDTQIDEYGKYIEVSLLPSALEYYRELSKHARKKKGRGNIPLPTVAPTTTSQVLSSAGWGIRYEFKLGLFAEIRQEMDVASKHYEVAYDGVLNEVFTTTSEWSERWKEARLLIDMLAFRVTRCALWMGNWAFAVRRMVSHIITTQDVLDKKGKGTGTYGYSAWLSNWYKLFAELIQAANIPFFEIVESTSATGLPPAAPTIYASFEPSMPPKEKIYPHYRLHHPGYYYLSAAENMLQRKQRVENTDDSDAQDTYLCGDLATERKLDHAGKIIELLRFALPEFESRQQTRMAGLLQLQITELLMEQANKSTNKELWRDCVKSLGVVSRQLRKDRWLSQLDRILKLRLRCAKEAQDLTAILATELELQDRRFSHMKQSLNGCLRGLRNGMDKTSLVVRGEDFVNFLDVNFAFRYPETHVGEHCASQLAISSRANPHMAPTVFSEICIAFEGNIRTIIIRHSAEEIAEPSGDNTYSIVDLKGKVVDHHSPTSPPSSPNAPRNFHSTTADLTLHPGQTRVFELYTILREAGEAKATCVTLCIDNEDFDLEIMHELEYGTYPFLDELGMGNIVGNGSRISGKAGKEATLDGGNGVWYEEVDKKVIRRPIRAMEPGKLKVLPKPPKMEIKVKDLSLPAFVNEQITISFGIHNEEEEAAETSLHAQILGYSKDVPIKWNGTRDEPALALLPLGKIEAGAKRIASFSFTALNEPTDATIEITAHYRLVSDPETPVSKTITSDLPVVNPFSTAYDFSPRVHQETWPSYFSIDVIDTEAGPKADGGLTQRWCLATTLSNVTANALTIVGHELPVIGIYGDATCSVIDGEAKEGDTDLTILTHRRLPFTLDVRKRTLEDRRSLSIDVYLALYWKRPDANVINKTILPVPRLPIPASEPRLLATASKAAEAPFPLQLTYILENPTSYFLTFSITMEGSDEFAFSGPKQLVIQLLPLSRHSVTYSLLPLHAGADGAWLKPVAKVVDRYFGKTLRCSPADENHKIKLVSGGATGPEHILVWSGDEPPQ